MSGKSSRTALLVPLLLLAAMAALFLTWREPPPADPTVSSPVPRLDPAELAVRFARSAPDERPTPAAIEEIAVAMNSFADWTSRYHAAAGLDRPEMVASGIATARARRSAMNELIRYDPASALALAAGETVRRELPPQVVAELEQIVAGRGDFTVDISCPPAGAGPARITRKLRFAGRDYDAHVHGRRAGLATKNNLPFHGVAADGAIALGDSGVLAVSTGSPVAAVLLARAAGHRADPGLAYFHGGEFQVAASPGNLAEIEALQAADEQTPGPDGASEESPFTEGTKTLLYIRVIFSDSTPGSNPVSLSQAQTHQDNLALFYQNNSFGITSVTSTIPPTVTLPKTAAEYGTLGWTTLLADARVGSAAAGYSTGSYNFYMVASPKVPAFSWAGRAFVGGTASHLNGDFTLRVAAHELGHNFGLYHANYNYTPSENPISREAYAAAPDNSPSQGYGNRYDMMGTLGSTTAYHFSPREKFLLGWIPSADAPVILQSGTHRLYRHDHSQAAGLRSLRVPSGDSLRPHFWLGFRRAFTANSYLSSGAEIIWGRSSNVSDGHLLVDSTPFSNDGSHSNSSSADNNDKVDAALTVGRMFGSPDSGAWFTVTGQGGTSPNEYIDITVAVGNFSANLPPAVSLLPATANVSLNANLQLSATATDPDGDPVTLSWDFGDATFAGNLTSTSKSWSSTGRYIVRVTAVDGKGGTASAHCVVRVGSPTTFTASGRILAGGAPVEGVRVFNSLTGSSYRGTRTDSEGRYVILNLASGSYTIGARKEGYIFAPANFTNSVAINSSVADLDFDATTAPAPYVIVDNTDASGVEITATTGSWISLSSVGGFHASDYITDNNSQKGQKQVVFRPDLPAAGLYRVSMRYTQSTNRATNVPVDIVHSDGSDGQETTTRFINQTVNGGTWLPLGDFQFAAGTQGLARIRTNGTDGHVAADSFKFELATNQPSGVRLVAVQPLARERGSVPALMRLEREGAADEPVTVHLGSLTLPPGEFEGGIATPGEDYITIPDTFTLAAGQTSLDIPLIPIPDSIPEGDEIAAFSLRQPPAPEGDWEFNESSGTDLASVQNSGTATLGWSVAIDGSTTTGEGVLRVRRASGMNGISHVALPALPDPAATTRHVLLETAGWSFSGTDPAETIRLGFTTGLNNTVVASLLVARTSGGVTLAGEATGTGGVNLDPVLISNTISTTTPHSFLLTVDPAAGTYRVAWRAGNEPFASLGTAATAPSRSPGALRLNVGGILNSTSAERFDIDRIRLGATDPSLPPYLILGSSEVVITIADDPRDDWRFKNFDPAQLADPLVIAWSADPDHDGHSNLLEYAFGTPPATPGGAAPVLPGIISDGGEDYLSITFDRFAGDELLDLSVEATADPAIAPWRGTAILHGPALPIVGRPGYERVTYRDTVPITTSPRRFLRVRASIPEP